MNFVPNQSPSQCHDIISTQEDDVLRILIATDNHLGVWENDEVRKNDSFDTFNEILELAAKHNVDFILLGGDLFHENKPSSNSVVRAIDSLSRYCLNDRSIHFQILGDQKVNFTTGRVNFENPNYNIGLPVFTIHGNHDDPTGTNNLSAVDILATGSLVNYFGKTQISGTGTGKIRISPIYIKKGNTKVALYGLGNIRDERLGRLFSSPNNIEWVRPKSTAQSDGGDWFNMFILHQNRTSHSQGAKNYVKESSLASFLDLVIWGHEHECLADPWRSNEDYVIIQPGSSVATALSEGESKPKHVVILEVTGQHSKPKWRTEKHRLETVRPFLFESVVLKGNVSEKTALLGGVDDGTLQKEITEFLEHKVEAMIRQAERKRGPRTPSLPLVRLRVDYTGFTTINTQRFGQKFVGKVANPHDIVIWYKSPARRTAKPDAGATNLSEDKRIEDLISSHLAAALELLPEPELTDALTRYVRKDEKTVFKETITEALKETQKEALKKTPVLEEDPDSLGESNMYRSEKPEEGEGVLIINAIKEATIGRKARLEVRSALLHAQGAAEERNANPNLSSNPNAYVHESGGLDSNEKPNTEVTKGSSRRGRGRRTNAAVVSGSGTRARNKLQTSRQRPVADEDSEDAEDSVIRDSEEEMEPNWQLKSNGSKRKSKKQKQASPSREASMDQDNWGNGGGGGSGYIASEQVSRWGTLK